MADQEPKNYILVIHSGEMAFPLRGAAQQLGYRIDPEFGKVKNDNIIEISLFGQGVRDGINLAAEKPEILKEIKARHARGEKMAAVIGCPVLTAEIQRQLAEEGIEMPADNMHIITQISDDEYRGFESHFRGIRNLMDTATSKTSMRKSLADKTDMVVGICNATIEQGAETPDSTLKESQSHQAGGDQMTR